MALSEIILRVALKMQGREFRVGDIVHVRAAEPHLTGDFFAEVLEVGDGWLSVVYDDYAIRVDPDLCKLVTRGTVYE